MFGIVHGTVMQQKGVGMGILLAYMVIIGAVVIVGWQMWKAFRK
jgi:predicted negative regulator of RcsB-dependent stress response